MKPIIIILYSKSKTAYRYINTNYLVNFESLSRPNFQLALPLSRPLKQLPRTFQPTSTPLFSCIYISSVWKQKLLNIFFFFFIYVKLNCNYTRYFIFQIRAPRNDVIIILYVLEIYSCLIHVYGDHSRNFSRTRHSSN